MFDLSIVPSQMLRKTSDGKTWVHLHPLLGAGRQKFLDWLLSAEERQGGGKKHMFIEAQPPFDALFDPETVDTGHHGLWIRVPEEGEIATQADIVKLVMESFDGDTAYKDVSALRGEASYPLFDAVALFLADELTDRTPEGRWRLHPAHYVVGWKADDHKIGHMLNYRHQIWGTVFLHVDFAEVARGSTRWNVDFALFPDVIDIILSQFRACDFGDAREVLMSRQNIRHPLIFLSVALMYFSFDLAKGKWSMMKGALSFSKGGKDGKRRGGIRDFVEEIQRFATSYNIYDMTPDEIISLFRRPRLEPVFKDFVDNGLRNHRILSGPAMMAAE
jgi:hypothetical protein